MLDRHPSRPIQAWEPAYAVRREWPDGTHDFIELSLTVLGAQAGARQDHEYWRRGPVRPRSWSVVVISARDFDLHVGRRLCRAPDCADADVAAPRRQSAPTEGPAG